MQVDSFELVEDLLRPSSQARAAERAFADTGCPSEVMQNRPGEEGDSEEHSEGQQGQEESEVQDQYDPANLK